MKEATWVPSLDLGNAKRVVQDFGRRAKPKNSKRVDEGINSTWRRRVSQTKHE